MSKRTLYQHFPSKAAVVEEYLRGSREHVEEPVRADPESADARTALLGLFATPIDGLIRLSTDDGAPNPTTLGNCRAVTQGPG